MTLRQIALSAGSLADRGTADDVRAVAHLVRELARSTAQVVQMIHDHESAKYPEFTTRLSDFLDGDEAPVAAPCVHPSVSIVPAFLYDRQVCTTCGKDLGRD